MTSIPVKQIDRMERAALKDLYFSLRVPVSSWVDHVNKLFTSLNMKDAIDEVDSVTIPILDHMVTEARDAEMRIPRLVASPVDRGRRLSAQGLPAAADQALSRDWGTFVRTYAINDGVQAPEPHWPRSKDPEAERAVSALVDDMDEDEEFLDYDGAKRWLPSLSEVRRSASHSSVHSVDSFADVDNWRSAVRPDAQRSSLVSSNSRNSWDSQAYYPDDSVSYPSYTNSTGTMPFEYHTKSCPQCGCERHCDASSKAQAPIQSDYATPSSTHRDTAVFLEPGISIIRPPISANPRVAATAKWELHPPKWR